MVAFVRLSICVMPKMMFVGTNLGGMTTVYLNVEWIP